MPDFSLAATRRRIASSVSSSPKAMTRSTRSSASASGSVSPPRQCCAETAPATPSSCSAAMAARCRSSLAALRTTGEPASAAQNADDTAGPMIFPGKITRVETGRPESACVIARAVASSRSNNTLSSARSTNGAGHRPPASALRACARTGDDGSRHSAAHSAMRRTRRSRLSATGMLSGAMLKQRIDRNTTALRRRSCEAPDELKAARHDARNVGRQDRSDRAAVAQIEDLKQSLAALPNRLAGDGIHDRDASPMRADLDAAARFALREVIGQVRIIPLTTQFAHAVFGNAKHARYAQDIGKPAIEALARHLARAALETARFDDAAAAWQLDAQSLLLAALEEMHESECRADHGDGLGDRSKHAGGGLKVQLVVPDQEGLALGPQRLTELRQHV